MSTNTVTFTEIIGAEQVKALVDAGLIATVVETRPHAEPVAIPHMAKTAVRRNAAAAMSRIHAATVGVR